MIDILVAAELAAQRPGMVNHMQFPHPFVTYGYFAGAFVLPFVAGLIHARSWKSCVFWVLSAVTVAGFVYAGGEITSAASQGATLEEVETLYHVALVLILPSLGAVMAGVAVRTLASRAIQQGRPATGVAA